MFDGVDVCSYAAKNSLIPANVIRVTLAKLC